MRNRWSIAITLNRRALLPHVFWRSHYHGFLHPGSRALHIFVCVLPCVVVHLTRASDFELWLEQQLQHCQCCEECADRPCDGVIAGGSCERRCLCALRARADVQMFRELDGNSSLPEQRGRRTVMGMIHYVLLKNWPKDAQDYWDELKALRRNPELKCPQRRRIATIRKVRR